MPQRVQPPRARRAARNGSDAAETPGAGAVPGAGPGSGAARGGALPFDPIQRAFDLWERRWGRSTSMLAVTSLMRAHQLVLAEVDAIVRPYGLTFARYEALVLLTFSRRGALPLSKIGERLQVHPTSVTNIVDRLANTGLVERKPNPLDGRGVLAEITAAGRAAVEKATTDLMAADFGLGALAEDQHLSLFGTLRELRLAAGDFSEGAGDAENEADGGIETEDEIGAEDGTGAIDGTQTEEG